MASAKLQGITMAPEQPQVVPTFLEVLDYKPAFQVVALFSPVGLLDVPDSRGRTCDRQARALLGGPAPARCSPPRCVPPSVQLLRGSQRGERRTPECHRVAHAQADGRGARARWPPTGSGPSSRSIPSSVSSSSTRTGPSDSPSTPKQGRPSAEPCSTGACPAWSGSSTRGFGALSSAHLLDAAACLWTARRVISRGVVHLPEHPEWDSEGLRMEFVQ